MASERELRRCLHCGKLLPRRKRRGAKFCSASHRVSHHQKRGRVTVERDPAMDALVDMEPLEQSRRWSEVLSVMRSEMVNTGDFDTYLSDAVGTLTPDGLLVVRLRNGFVKEWVRSRCLGQLIRVTSRVYGVSRVRLLLAVDGDEKVASLRAIGLAGSKP